MSFKEALSNFISGYEEDSSIPSTAVEGEEPKEVEEATEETPEEVVEPVGDEAVDKVIEDVEEEAKEAVADYDPKDVPTPILVNPEYAEFLIAKTLPAEVRASLDEGDIEKMMKMDKSDFMDALDRLAKLVPPKAGKISKAMKPSKSEPEEDWTLALFNS